MRPDTRTWEDSRSPSDAWFRSRPRKSAARPPDTPGALAAPDTVGTPSSQLRTNGGFPEVSAALAARAGQARARWTARPVQPPRAHAAIQPHARVAVDTHSGHNCPFSGTNRIISRRRTGSPEPASKKATAIPSLSARVSMTRNQLDNRELAVDVAGGAAGECVKFLHGLGEQQAKARPVGWVWKASAEGKRRRRVMAVPLHDATC